MNWRKRVFDVVLACLLLAILAPVATLIAAWLLVRQGRPVFHVSIRCHAPGQVFGLIKFRTMHADPGDRGVSGGDKRGRITRDGAWLRASRLDEVPQLLNILRGDLSFVGPRPPLPEYVNRFEPLYTAVLRNRPGLTGLATLVFHRHEAALLAACRDAGETDAVYARRCVPRKARLDLIYQARQSLWLDAVLLWRTLRAILAR